MFLFRSSAILRLMVIQRPTGSTDFSLLSSSLIKRVCVVDQKLRDMTPWPWCLILSSNVRGSGLCVHKVGDISSQYCWFTTSLNVDVSIRCDEMLRVG